MAQPITHNTIITKLRGLDNVANTINNDVAQYKRTITSAINIITRARTFISSLSTNLAGINSQVDATSLSINTDIAAIRRTLDVAPSDDEFNTAINNLSTILDTSGAPPGQGAPPPPPQPRVVAPSTGWFGRGGYSYQGSPARSKKSAKKTYRKKKYKRRITFN